MRCFKKWVGKMENIIPMLKYINCFAWAHTNAIRDRGQSS